MTLMTQQHTDESQLLNEEKVTLGEHRFFYEDTRILQLC